MNILFISLGCDKNLVDSEIMLGLIKEKGFRIIDDETKADVIVVNTCCFINDAKEESIDTILSMAQLKKSGNLKVLIAAGCMAQRYKEEMIKEIPELDGIVGTNSYEDIIEVIETALAGKVAVDLKDLDYLPEQSGTRVNTTGGYYSYLKIAEGCDKHCTYCIIPKIRGNYRSVPMEQLLPEAKRMADNGVVELILVAQETTIYGVDLYGKNMLPTLLRELCKIEGIKWIRLLYCYPEEITDELIQVIKEENKICKYLDMPVQHASDVILKRMGRRTNRAQLEERIEKLRAQIPDIALRTTLITGFPNETEEDHKLLLDFVEKMKFDRLGVFTYSPEEDTPAASMDGQIKEEVKEKRKEELMLLQQKIAFEKAQDMLSSKLEVLIEGRISGEDIYIGRTYKDAPNVDGYIFVSCSHELLSGEFVTALVTDAKEYDLIGQIIWED